MLRTEQLEVDRAFLSVTFLDADKHPLVTFESEETADTRGWKKISLGPVAPPSRETKLAVIGLHVEPRGRGFEGFGRLCRHPACASAAVGNENESAAQSFPSARQSRSDLYGLGICR